MKNEVWMIPEYAELTDQQTELISKTSFIIKHKKGELIFMQNRPVSHVIYVKSGLVKLYKEIQGKTEIILDILPAGQFAGLTSLFYDNLYPYSASSLEEGELVYTGSSDFMELIANNKKFGIYIMSLLSARVINMIDRVISLTKKQVPGRMAEMLLHFSKDIYKSDAFILPISRTEIAELIQATKETVSRTLTEFKNDRIIELDEKNVALKSTELLEILNRIG
jgi:CRP-like cAMP-binding protein